MSGSNAFLCTNCGEEYPLHSCDRRCECGGQLDLRDRPPLDATQIDASQSGVQLARGGQILSAARATGGVVLAAAEEEIEHTRNQLARQGFYVEESAAVTVTALTNLQEILPVTAGELGVMPLTGHGLKTTAEL